MATSGAPGWLLAIFGLNRAGKILYTAAFVLTIPAFILWTVVLPRMRFGDEDERLFHAARHGDVAGIEQALDAGAGVNDEAPIDGKTALFRAAVFGYADAVKKLLERGADPAVRGSDGRTALEVVAAAIDEEKEATARQALEAVAGVLRSAR